MPDVQLISIKGVLWMQPRILEVENDLFFYFKREEKEQDTLTYEMGQAPDLEMKKPPRARTKFIVTKEPLFRVTQDGSAILTHNGLLARIKARLQELKISFSYERKGEPWPVPVLNENTLRGLRRMQQEAVIYMALSVGGGRILAATSAGKTFAIAALLRAHKGLEALVCTHSVSVVEGLHYELSNHLKDDGIELGMWTGSVHDEKMVTICTIRSLDAFDVAKKRVLIGDEFHRVAGPGASRLWLAYDNAVKFGLSATMIDRFDGKDKFLEALGGPIVYEITDQEIETLGWVPPLNVYFMKVPGVLQGEDAMTKYQIESFGIVYSRARNQLVKEVVDLCPPDQQLLIFVRTIKHIKFLMKDFLDPEQFVICHAQLPAKQQRAIKDGFKFGRIKRIISTDTLMEGVDPRALMVMIDLSGVKGDAAMIQKCGRLRRMAKDKAFGVLINFEDDHSNTLKRRAGARAKLYKQKGHTILRHKNPSDIVFCMPPEETLEADQE